MQSRDIIRAVDIDFREANVSSEINEEIAKYIKSLVVKKLNQIKKTESEQRGDDKFEVTEELKEKVKADVIASDDVKKYKEFLAENVRKKIQNYSMIRNEIDNMNELHVLGSHVERLGFQDLVMKSLKELIKISSDNIDDYNHICGQLTAKIDEYINRYKGTELKFRKKYNNLFDEKDSLQILLNMRKLYTIKKDMDGVELYDMFNMFDNIDMSNLLSDICFYNCANNIKSNLLNELNHTDRGVGKLIQNNIVTNKLLGCLLRNTLQRNTEDYPDFPIITNNAVTCLDTTYTTTMTDTKVYSTRTLGELLFEITNEDLRYIDKTQRQQIYMTYDGSRPKSDEYWKWNGLQVFDIDLKEWVKRGNNIKKLKDRLFETLSDFRWFLWICFSSSGRGIHIYTKVAPPHHVYIKDEAKNNQISEYCYRINYYTKASIIYTLFYKIRNEFGFTEEDFMTAGNESQYSTGFELKCLDNTVGRITSGIRLTYDPDIMVNMNFMDLPIFYNLCQTYNGFNYKKDIDNIIFRNTKISRSALDTIEELYQAMKNPDKTEPEKKVNISELVLQGYDITKYKELPISAIKYKLRYEVCNTLAALYGKDGLQLAHMILRSSECRNEKEINAFYASALRNKKEASKFGLDVLQKVGVVKSVNKEFDETLVDKYKLFLKKQIEKSAEVSEQDYNLRLGDGEYLGTNREKLLDLLKQEKINLIYAAPASGKCLGKDTPVLMYDGSIKMVQDIKEGDLLMGIDSTPRTVISTCHGIDDMFRITPFMVGEPYVCNRAHLSSFVKSGEWIYEKTSEGIIPPRVIYENTVDDLSERSFTLSSEDRHHMKLFHMPVNFPKRKVTIHPYFLGLWLGDGNTKDQAITVGEEDYPITYEYLKKYADYLGMDLTNYKDKRNGVNLLRITKNIGQGKINLLKEEMKHYNLLGNKHIPIDYLRNDRKTRLMLLAGLIDSDGCLSSQAAAVEYATKLENLANDVCYLARSLGYGVSKTPKVVNGVTYYRVRMAGVGNEVPIRIKRKKPTKKSNTNPLTSGFKIEPLGKGEYFGFVINGDKRFMLGDFTVTHNTELIKSLARQKRVMLVLPFISVIKNKIESDESIMELFDCYYDNKDISKIEHGINAVTTFDKFSRADYEKISRMFDYIVIDEEHLLFNSQYRIHTTSNSIKKLRQLQYIASNDPFSAKILMMTGTPTGSEFFFKNNGNFIRVYKKMMDKSMEFHICNDLLDATTRMAYKCYQLINQNHKIIIPTNKGDIYTEKLVGMIRHLLGRDVRYGYYKRANNEQDIVANINQSNTVGDYEIIFCTNYLSVGIDINDTTNPFAVMYLGNWSAFEIEQFNSRIRRQNIQSFYFIKTLTNNNKFDDLLYEEPEFQLRLTDEDIENFKDDKEIAAKKQEFIAVYDPLLNNITTPGFSTIAGQIKFNKEEYELVNFENKYSECFQHPLKVASVLASYGYNISVSLDFDGLDINLQTELKQVGIDSAKEEKVRKNDLMIGTFMDLIKLNKYVSQQTMLEFNNTIEYIMKNTYDVVEDRDMADYVSVTFNQFAQPEKIFVKSKVALDKMIRPAYYLIQRYSPNKCYDIINQYIDSNGILKKKNFQRAVNLLKLVEAHGNNELSVGVEKVIENIYEYTDKFIVDENYLVSYSSYMTYIDNLTNDYIAFLGMNIRTRYGYDKIRESILEIFKDITVPEKHGKNIRFKYNKMPEQDSSSIINRRSVDILIEKMFAVTNDVISSSKLKLRENHIVLEPQKF